MREFLNRENYIQKTLVFAILMFSFISCTDLGNGTLEKDNLIDPQVLENSVKRISVQPVKSNNLDGPYKVSIRFKDNIDKGMPDSIVLCGMENVKPLKRNKENPLSYTSVTNDSKIKELYLSSKNGENYRNRTQGGLTIGCDVSFTRPGDYDENCKARCSDRSIFGGRTWFCICVYKCHIDAEF